MPTRLSASGVRVDEEGGYVQGIAADSSDLTREISLLPTSQSHGFSCRLLSS